MRLIDADAAIEALETVKAENGELYIAKINAQMKLENLPPVQSEWGWHPITEKPPRGKDLILKIYDKRNLFYYYHMGFYSANQYRTYNFFWQYDEDLEVVGWQLCPWEGK